MAAISSPPTCCNACKGALLSGVSACFRARSIQAANIFCLWAKSSPCIPVPAPVKASTCLSSNNALKQLADEVLPRSEEHTSELQSRPHLVCRLLLEKKKKKKNNNI